MKDEYLGDGVYASFDGYHIRLDLRGQDNTTYFALEPPVLDALENYRQRIIDSIEEKHNEQESTDKISD